MNTLKAKKHWDIFCRIVDNYGDIGVCWRLAKQLAHEHRLTVRLFVDCGSDESIAFDSGADESTAVQSIAAAQRIIPNLNLSQSTQTIDGVEVLFWTDKLVIEQVGEVVIEAFACGLPASVSEKIQAKQADAKQIDAKQALANNTRWINLEYLSAENWVDDFHATVSVNPSNGLMKHFFFPGFNEATGGLLREADLIVKRDEFLANTAEQNKFWQQLGVAHLKQNSAQDCYQNSAQASIKVSLFCYPHAPILNLLQSMATGKHLITLFVPSNAVLAAIATFFELDNQAVTVGSRLTKGNLQVLIIPFLSQNDYDKLLWSCDINFVRGEDSWLRAVWAAKPFIWQPYFQQEQAHLVKLNAFLNTYYHGFQANTNNNRAMRYLSLAWATDNKATATNQNEHLANTAKLPSLNNASLSNNWSDFVDNLARYKHHARAYTQQLGKQPDLAAKLVIFCNK